MSSVLHDGSKSGLLFPGTDPHVVSVVSMAAVAR